MTEGAEPRITPCLVERTSTLPAVRGTFVSKAVPVSTYSNSTGKDIVVAVNGRRVERQRIEKDWKFVLLQNHGSRNNPQLSALMRPLADLGALALNTHLPESVRGIRVFPTRRVQGLGPNSDSLSST
jgi:hypothetical protein